MFLTLDIGRKRRLNALIILMLLSYCHLAAQPLQPSAVATPSAFRT